MTRLHALFVPGAGAGMTPFALSLLVVVAMGGCNREEAERPQGGAPSISANPNPVPAGVGPGTTTISWSTGGPPGEVWVVRLDEGQERRFAKGNNGSKEAKFIARGKTYDFRLYQGTEHEKVLGSVSVTALGAARARGAPAAAGTSTPAAPANN